MGFIHFRVRPSSHSRSEARRSARRNCLDLVSPATRPTLVELLRRGVSERRGWRDLVLHLPDAKGGIRWLENNALPLTDGAGAVTGYRGVARDITQRRVQQERIARLSRIQPY